ncbi:methyltransferase, partial [Rhizobium ruizarguesonis]
LKRPSTRTGDFASLEIISSASAGRPNQKSRGLTRLDLYEADHAALEDARDNLAENCPNAPVRFFWHDLAGEPVKDKYD